MYEPSRLPEDLELMTPGPRLAALLSSVDRSGLDAEQLLRLARARDRLVAHQQAQLLADLHAVAHAAPGSAGSATAVAATGSEPGRDPWAECEIGFALRWSHGWAARQLSLSQEVIDRLPEVFAALNGAEIDLPKARVIVDAVSCLEERLARSIVEKVLATASRYTVAELRARLRRLVLAADPSLAAARARRDTADRRVEGFLNDNNLAALAGYELAPHRVAAALERLDAIAAAAKAAGDPRKLDQLRADAFMDLLVGDGVAGGGWVTDGGFDADPCRDDGPRDLGTDESDTTDLETNRLGATDLDTNSLGANDDTAGQARRREPPWSDATVEPARPPEPDTPWPDAPADPSLLDPDAYPTDQAAGPPERSAGLDPGLHPAPDAGFADLDPPDAVPAVRWRPPEPGEPPGPPIDARQVELDNLTLAGFHALSTSPPGHRHRATVRSPAGGDARRLSTADAGAAAGRGRTRGDASRPAMPAPRRGVVDIQVPLTTLLGLTRLPGELAGWGPVIADIARQVTHQQRSATWRYSVYSTTGELLHHGVTRRRPAGADTAFVKARDRRCRAPGCRRAARGCDVDHTVDWAQTNDSRRCNLACLCRLHHRFKHESGAELTQLHPGILGWRTPAGMRYVTHPDPYPVEFEPGGLAHHAPDEPAPV